MTGDRRLSKQNIRISPDRLFFLISLAGIAGFFLLAIMNGHTAWEWMAQENNPDMVGVDYFRHIDGSLRGAALYESTNFCFPAFAYVLYFYLYRLSTWPRGGVPNGLLIWEQTRRYQLVFAGYLILTVLLIFIAVMIFCRRRGCSVRQCVLLAASIMLSAAFLGSGFLTGNSTMPVIGILIIALQLRDSRSWFAREAALLLIAVAAGLKMYPAVFGFLYLKEKRWGEAVRLIIYGIMIMFLPFQRFGGLPVIMDWLDNIFSTMGGYEYGRIQFINGIAYMALTKITGNPESSLVMIGCRVIPYVFLLLMIILGFISRSRYRTILFFTCAMVFFPSNAFRYTLGYMALPLLSWFISCQETFNGEDWLASVLFGNIFTIPVWIGMLTGFAMNLGWYTLTWVELWIYVSAYFLLLAEIIIELKDWFSRQRVSDGINGEYTIHDRQGIIS